MYVKQSQRFDKTVPTLIVKYGHTAKKYLGLDRSGIILGRARGCDIELEAPDISPVHCVITRGTTGLYVRDCGSRVGTKVNGEKVHEAVLHDGDILLIGGFSFEVYLPWKVPPPDTGPTSPVDKERLKRLERSRGRLASLALAIRRRLRAERAASAVAEPAAAETLPIDTLRSERARAERQAELSQQEDIWAGRLRELEQREQGLLERQALLERRSRELEETTSRLVELEQRLEIETTALEEKGRRLLDAENRLEAETNALEEKGRRLVEIQAQFDARRELEARELTALRNHVARASQELTERRARFEEECARAEQPTGAPGVDLEEVRRLELRGRELACYARHLRHSAATLQERRRLLQQAVAELHNRLASCGE